MFQERMCPFSPLLGRRASLEDSAEDQTEPEHRQPASPLPAESEEASPNLLVRDHLPVRGDERYLRATLALPRTSLPAVPLGLLLALE